MSVRLGKTGRFSLWIMGARTRLLPGFMVHTTLWRITGNSTKRIIPSKGTSRELDPCSKLASRPNSVCMSRFFASTRGRPRVTIKRVTCGRAAAKIIVASVHQAKHQDGRLGEGSIATRLEGQVFSPSGCQEVSLQVILTLFSFRWESCLMLIKFGCRQRSVDYGQTTFEEDRTLA